MINLRKKQKGFTLVELLIVIAIIAVLAAVVTPVALGAINDSKATAVYAEIKAIETADLTHYVQKGSIAANITDLELYGIETATTKNAEYALSGTYGERKLTVKVSDSLEAKLNELIVPNTEFEVIVNP